MSAAEDFILKYAARKTLTARGRRLAGNYQLKRKSAGWVAYFGEAGATTPVTASRSMLDYARRTPLSHWIEEGVQAWLDRQAEGSAWTPAGRP